MIFDNSESLDVINVVIDNNSIFTINGEKVRFKKYLGLIIECRP